MESFSIQKLHWSDVNSQKVKHKLSPDVFTAILEKGEYSELGKFQGQPCLITYDKEWLTQYFEKFLLPIVLSPLGYAFLGEIANKLSGNKANPLNSNLPDNEF